MLVVIGGAALYPPLLFAFGGLKVSEVKAALKRQPRTPDIEEDFGKTPAGPDLL